MELNVETIRAVSAYLDIETEIDSDNKRFDDLEELLKTIELDYSSLPYLEATKPLKKTARVIEICRMEHCDHFINAIGGQALYDKKNLLVMVSSWISSRQMIFHINSLHISLSRTCLS